MSWIQATVSADGAMTDAVCECLQALGALSVSIEGGGGEEVLEPGPGQTPMWSVTEVSALFDASDDEAAKLESRVLGALAGLGTSRVQLTPVADRDWVGAWRHSAAPRCFGDGLWVVPQDAAEPSSARAVVRLDPGLAFGTGAHPTTALCLQWLAGLRLAGLTVLDIGCGSGILSIAAVKLGAARVLAVDHDEQALLATRANAILNQVSERVTVVATLPEQAVEVVLANILANTLQELAPRIKAVAAPGAPVVLSGILDSQVEQVWACYADAFEDRQVSEMEGWVRIGARRCPLA